VLTPRDVIANMDEMSGYFARVSVHMGDMRRKVASMTDDVRMVPIVTAQMREIGGHLETMRADVNRMRLSTGAIDERIDGMNLSIADMSGRFRSLNQSIGLMGADVDQMSRAVP
jgi:hypothetical protein